ncbi:MAG: hypothetical protein A2931_01360 [Candidatus Niyogibacteria bacterium RIFCSPLOWO2_01_FULL_45_48]|uniref:Peptidase M42 n=2 Tax=Candidatus Niyogiibacteriota TaxID=1817912 RepID=A0A1G2EXA4_9BACT|nr:MAG: hypothetical protein A2931_01360 [Candidatus Niyogibacteria bacterium RIFCSPLOWO2_01_FULL_45_48]OGZ29701.1 MAG: hypothetical protein A2835_00875 [Candidatus Niyogibacteria bacterium RIFCSPHIGHO2_01_FULL_45_28]OGZ30435.1 MAG: hypothetical protein A3J00_04150 [Candidatus Niyogibacteria bacterium RIFCSPLOWO2_02_FULL_45_13]
MGRVNETLLKQLIELPAPSGSEWLFQQKWMSLVKPYADEVVVLDRALGNCAAVLNKGGLPKIMFSAHSDEVRMVVGSIAENGFIFLKNDEGIDLSLVPGREVWIINLKNELIRGVIGRWATHLEGIIFKQEDSDARKIHEYWIDIGVKNGIEIRQRGIEEGCPVIFSSGYHKLNAGFYYGRNLDNRAGVYVLVEMLKTLYKTRDRLKAEVWIVSTVQEESSDTMPVKIAAEVIKPDVGIIIDTEEACDYPAFDDLDRDYYGNVKLEEGPVLRRGLSINPTVSDLLKKIAKKFNIPHRIGAVARSEGAVTEASYLAIAGLGIPVGEVLIPIRYMHSPYQLGAFDDLYQTKKLLTCFTRALNSKTILGYK